MQRIIEGFPRTAFQSKSEYQPLLEALEQLGQREEQPRHAGKAAAPRVDRVLFKRVAGEEWPCNKILACFLASLGSFLFIDPAAEAVMRELGVMVVLFRKLLNLRGYSKKGVQPQPDAEYCADPENSVKVFIELVDHFITELFPSFFSNLVQ